MTAETPGPLAVDRQARVLDMLGRHGSARVSELAEVLGVTAVTVRRDIAQLAAEGVVTRVHGGVTLAPAAGTAAAHPAATDTQGVPTAATPVPAAGTIGMLVPSLDYYWPGVARGVEHAAREHGLRVVLRGTSYDSPDDRPQLERLVERLAPARRHGSPAGLVVAPRTDSGTAPATFAWLASTGMPVVLAERAAPARGAPIDFDTVHSDHAAGAGAAVQHLADLGHRRIGLVVSTRSPTSPQLRRGWLTATEGLDRTIDVAIPDPGRPGAPQEIAAVLDACRRTGTTAVLVHADATAIALVQVLEQHGLSVPGDLSVIAYDDEVAGLFSPRLTAVRPHRRALGRAAVALLTARIAEPDRPAHRLLITPSLRVRESTAPPGRSAPVPPEDQR